MFGGFNKLPDAARSLGRSLRIFKTETQGLIKDDEPKSVEAAPAAPVADAPVKDATAAAESATTAAVNETEASDGNSASN